MNKKIKSLLLSLSMLVIIGMSSALAGSTTPSISIDKSHNVKIMSGDFMPNKYYRRYDLETALDKESTILLSLGHWDMCSLSRVQITGEDNTREDIGACTVFIANSTGEKETAGSYDYSKRPYWKIIAEAYHDVNQVKCSAICMSFTQAQTGK